MIPTQFEPATREQIKLRLALTGPSGSGKSLTALQIATQLAQIENGRIAAIDTEGRSLRKYAGELPYGFAFDVIELTEYNPQLFIEAIYEAARQKYSVILIDSLSHAWNGRGGVLDIVDAAGKRLGGNDWAGWSKGRPMQNALIDAVLTADIHIIATMRSKTEWQLQVNEKGKQVPVKVGLGVVQSADFEYEFDVVGLIDMDHAMTITKTRCIAVPSGETITDVDELVERLVGWMRDGILPPPWFERDSQRKRIDGLIQRLRTRYTNEQIETAIAALGEQERYASADEYGNNLKNYLLNPATFVLPPLPDEYEWRDSA